MDHQHTLRYLPEDEHLGMEHIICIGCLEEYWQDRRDTSSPLPEAAAPDEALDWSARYWQAHTR